MQIEIQRAASLNIANYNGLLLGAAPALVRQPSNQSEKVIINVPKLNFLVVEEEKKEVMISTGEPEVLDSIIPFCDKIH